MILTVRLNPFSTELEVAMRSLGNVDGLCRDGFCTRRFRVLIPSSLLASRLTLRRRRMARSVCRFPVFYLLPLPPLSGITHVFIIIDTSKIMQRLTKALVLPWGRFGPEIRKDLMLAQKPEKEGGTGTAEKFWDWSDEQMKPYM